MKESVHKYFQIGTIQWMDYPQKDPMESLKAICKDDFFDAIGLKGYGDKNEEAKKLLEQSHLKVCYGTQLRLLGGKLSPDDLNKEGRREAEATLVEAVDEAKYLDAKGTAFLAGKWQPETEDQAYAQLLKATRAVHDHATTRDMMVELGVFDYGMGKVALASPAPYTAEFAVDTCIAHNSFRLLVGLSRFPTTYEIDRFVVRALRPYITHFHFGDIAVVKGYDGYDDFHPRFGYPNNANDTPQLLDYLRVMKKEGFLDTKGPYVLPMEVTLHPDEDESIVLANAKGVLNRAWALLKDNA